MPAASPTPMQCRGADSKAASVRAIAGEATLYEEMVIDQAWARESNSRFPRLSIDLPSFADLPRTDVYFADTADTLGPLGAKSMSESPYNPVAAALGNALADATGIRFTSVPFKPDRLLPLLQEKFGR